MEGDPDGREKFACRACETITQPPGAVPSDRPGPSPLVALIRAHVMAAKRRWHDRAGIGEGQDVEPGIRVRLQDTHVTYQVPIRVLRHTATRIEEEFFQLAELARAPLIVEAVRRIDAIFDVERSINGLPVAQRLAIRKQMWRRWSVDSEFWMRAAMG